MCACNCGTPRPSVSRVCTNRHKSSRRRRQFYQVWDSISYARCMAYDIIECACDRTSASRDRTNRLVDACDRLVDADSFVRVWDSISYALHDIWHKGRMRQFCWVWDSISYAYDMCACDCGTPRPSMIVWGTNSYNYSLRWYEVLSHTTVFSMGMSY